MKWLLAAVTLLLFTGITYAQSDIMGTEAQQAAGKQIYDAKCAQCHGYDGKAQSVGKEYFRPQPRDFSTATFKFRSTGSGDLPTHEDIKRSIREGMPYSGMPPWPNFSDKELDNLAYYLKTFSSDFEEFGDVQPIAIPDVPDFSQASAERGRIVFEENQCIDCHGNYGRGDGPSAPTLKDQWEQTIRAADLTKPWTFRRGSTRKDIYITFNTGLDGSPMPSYNIQPPEDQWALVDYVYSLRESDLPEYGTAVVASNVNNKFEVSEGPALFANAEMARFAIVGQVVEPGRAFYPGVNAVDVSAVYNSEDIAIMLSWHDMSAERSGQNSPDMAVPAFEEQSQTAQEADSAGTLYSDAVAVLLPAAPSPGLEMPYFMFGDDKRPMDIWFADLAKDRAECYRGKGSDKLTAVEDPLGIYTAYEDGRWTVIFKRQRVKADGLSFQPDTFTPIAFSIWDGFNKERGNKRGLTSWYYIYLEPVDVASPVAPMIQYSGLTFLMMLGIVAFVRYRNREQHSNDV